MRATKTKMAEVKASRKISGMDAAIIAVKRYRDTSIFKRSFLNKSGVGLGEALTILAMQIMLDPGSVTDEELLHLIQVDEDLGKEEDDG